MKKISYSGIACRDHFATSSQNPPTAVDFLTIDDCKAHYITDGDASLLSPIDRKLRRTELRVEASTQKVVMLTRSRCLQLSTLKCSHNLNR